MTIASPSAADSLRKADTLFRLGRIREAKKELLRGLESSPDHPWLLGSLAHAHLAEGDSNRAREFAERSIAAAPDDPFGFRILSTVLTQQGLHAASVEAAQKSVSLAPNDFRALLQLFSAAFRAAYKDLARDVATRLMNEAPENAMSHVAMGLATSDQDPLKAEAHFRRALEIDPESASAMNNLGVVLNKQNKMEAATEMFANAARLDPTSTRSQKNLLKPKVGIVAFWGGLLIASAQALDCAHRPSIDADGPIPYGLTAILLFVAGFMLKDWLFGRDLKLLEQQTALTVKRGRRQSMRRWLLKSIPLVFLVAALAFVIRTHR